MLLELDSDDGFAPVPSVDCGALDDSDATPGGTAPATWS
jgi:hypothetical protein